MDPKLIIFEGKDVKGSVYYDTVMLNKSTEADRVAVCIHLISVIILDHHDCFGLS